MSLDNLTLEKYRRADEAKIKELTLQIETNTIGIIYDKGNAGTDGDSDDTGTSGVQFTPSEFIRDIPTDAHGNNIELNSKGFETLEIHFFTKTVLRKILLFSSIVKKEIKLYGMNPMIFKLILMSHLKWYVVLIYLI